MVRMIKRGQLARMFPRSVVGGTQRRRVRPLSKSALAKLAAVARSIERKIARNLRLQAEAVAKSQRLKLRQQKKEARLSRERLAKARGAARRGASQARRADLGERKLQRNEYRDRLRRLNESLFGREKVQQRAESQRQSNEYRRRLRKLNESLFGKEKAAEMRRDEQYARRLQKLNDALFGKKQPKNLPGKPGRKTASTRRNGKCVHNLDRTRTARGRRTGAKPTYSDRNTARYQSLWLRMQKALKLNAPIKKDNYYLFRPAANCRGNLYRVTPLQQELKAIVKTKPSPQVTEQGGAKSKWDFTSPVFKWAVKYPAASESNPDSGLFLPGPVPPNNIPPPAVPAGSGRTVYGYIYFQNWLIEQCVGPPALECQAGGTGVQRSGVLGSTSMLFYYRDEDAPAPPPARPLYLGAWPYNSVSGAAFSFGSGRFGPFIYNDRQPFAPQPPQPVYYSNPDSPFPGDLGNTGGDPAAGIVWESEPFPLLEQFDILLSFAYSVRAAGDGETYVEILQNGISWKRLTLIDYTKGVHRAALPVTMLAGAVYQFRIVIDVSSNIDAAIVRLGGTYVCNCPDYAKVEKKSPGRYTSQMRDRNWEPSAAGIKVFGDCKHIMRVKLLRGEGLEPTEPPDLDALRAWRKGRKTQDGADRKQQRKAQTQARRGIKADLAARRRQDRAERLAPARARRKAKRDAVKARKAKRLQFERLNPGLVALKKKERDSKKARKRFEDRLANRTPDARMK